MSPDEFIARVYEAGVVPLPKVVAYGDEVSPHLHVGLDFLWSPDTDEYSQLPQCIALFEEVRTNVWKKPIGVDAGYRTRAHEDELTAEGLQTAMFVSPHSVGSADDYRVLAGTYQTTQTQANVALRQAFRAAADNLKLPQPRIGHKQYKEHFCHVDLMFMLFAPYTGLAHPKDWTDLQQEMRDAYSLTLKPGWEW